MKRCLASVVVPVDSQQVAEEVNRRLNRASEADPRMNVHIRPRDISTWPQVRVTLEFEAPESAEAKALDWVRSAVAGVNGVYELIGAVRVWNAR